MSPSRIAPPQVRAGLLQQRDAFDVVGHRKDADGVERERASLPTTAMLSRNLLADLRVFGLRDSMRPYLSATCRDSKRAPEGAGSEVRSRPQRAPSGANQFELIYDLQ